MKVMFIPGCVGCDVQIKNEEQMRKRVGVEHQSVMKCC